MTRTVDKILRRESIRVNVWTVTIGGKAPIVVQSMTNTDTADIQSTTEQILQLARAGSEIVRITVDREEAAAAEQERLSAVTFADLVEEAHAQPAEMYYI